MAITLTTGNPMGSVLARKRDTCRISNEALSGDLRSRVVVIYLAGWGTGLRFTTDEVLSCGCKVHLTLRFLDTVWAKDTLMRIASKTISCCHPRILHSTCRLRKTVWQFFSRGSCAVFGICENIQPSVWLQCWSQRRQWRSARWRTHV